MRIEGAITAIVTPFRQDLSFDEGAFRNLMHLQHRGGIDGIVVLGTTGESPTVDHAEHRLITEVAIDERDSLSQEGGRRMAIYAGTGSNSTAEAVSLTEHAAEHGADAALVVTPYYNKPTPEGIYHHFRAVAEVGLPIILYSIQGRTGLNIEPPTMQRLFELENIISVKESSGNISQIGDMISICPEGKTVLSGDDALVLPVMALGGYGGVSVVANAFPDQFASLVHIAQEGRLDEAREMHYSLLPLMKADFIETNPIPIKFILSRMGLIEEVYRLPLTSLSEESRKKVLHVLKESPYFPPKITPTDY